MHFRHLWGPECTQCRVIDRRVRLRSRNRDLRLTSVCLTSGWWGDGIAKEARPWKVRRSFLQEPGGHRYRAEDGAAAARVADSPAVTFGRRVELRHHQAHQGPKVASGLHWGLRGRAARRIGTGRQHGWRSRIGTRLGTRPSKRGSTLGILRLAWCGGNHASAQPPFVNAQPFTTGHHEPAVSQNHPDEIPARQTRQTRVRHTRDIAGPNLARSRRRPSARPASFRFQQSGSQRIAQEGGPPRLHSLRTGSKRLRRVQRSGRDSSSGDRDVEVGPGNSLQ